MKKHVVSALVPSVIVLIVAACSSDDDLATSVTPDAGPGLDGSRPADGQANVPTDAGNDVTIDSGTPDADSGSKTCAQTTCSSDATCNDSSGTPVCTCKPGFSGDGGTCTTVNNCAGVNPCMNGGTCLSASNGYTCTCTPGYSGTNCETNINDCSPNPCQNGGTCVDGVNGYTCTCAPGYSGTTCETNINECAPNPCLNGGTCVDGVNGYTCTCAPGYSGTTCQTNINECAPNPCLNGGTCADGVNSYTCTCAPGYSGTTCQTNIDECASNPCQNGGGCTDGVNSYTCTCVNGWIGQDCTTIPTSCNALKIAIPSTPSGQYAIDPDGPGGSAPFNVYCDMTTAGGGWTIVSSYSGAANEQPLTSDTETSGNALAFAGSNLNRAKKMAIALGATESLLLRSDATFIRLNKALFDSQLATANTHVHTDIVITANDGTVVNGYMGYSNYNNGSGGDFGISMNPDGPTAGGGTVQGFDHHSTGYYHLNWGCVRHYLYRYGGGSGYNVNTGVGSWAAGAPCDATPGGDLAFYAAMR